MAGNPSREKSSRSQSSSLIKGVSGIAFSVALAYSLAVRFTEILFLPRGEKIFLLSSFIFITTVITAWITMVLLPSLIRPLKRKILFILALTGFLLTSLLFAAVYSPPPFPEQHNLTISVEGSKNPLSDGASVNIASISTVSLPTGAERSVPITGFVYDGVWQGSIDNFSLSTDGSQPVSLEYEKFMQAGMKVKFITGPASGIVKINWDGNESEVDLYAPEQGEKIVPFAPAFNLRTADRTRQVLVAGALLTDLISASASIFFLLISAATIFSGRKFELRNPSFLLLGLMVTAAAFFYVSSAMQPVIFENPQLESVVRTALEKPQGPVYERQLRTIASLDASSSGITDISGIGILTELKDIDLSHNHLTDISPLALFHIWKNSTCATIRSLTSSP